MSDLSTPENVAKYLKAKPGLRRLIDGIIEKIRTYGEARGRVEIVQPSQVEDHDLRSLFGYKYYKNMRKFDKIVVPVDRFITLFESPERAFFGVDPIDVIEAYAGKKLTSRKYDAEQANKAKEGFFRFHLGSHPSPDSKIILDKILSKDKSANVFSRLYPAVNTDRDLRLAFDRFLAAFAHLPKEYKTIAVFATETCGDPHALDRGTVARNLIRAAFKIIAGFERADVFLPFSVREASLFYQNHIIFDDVHNDLAVANLCFSQETIRHDSNFRFKRLIERRDKQILNTFVFAVENAGVFSYLEDKLDFADFQGCLVCFSGQPRAVVWEFLRIAEASKVPVWYSGDLDPAGVHMAQNYKLQHPNTVRLWGFNKDLYNRVVGGIEESESFAHRLNSLKGIRLTELAPLVSAMMANRRRVVQEILLDDMLEFLREANKIGMA